MYFPYLFGRRSEFLATRALLKERGPLDTWAPVIEPVNRNIGDLSTFASIFGKAGARALILINPDLHQLASKDAATTFRKETMSLFSDYPSLVPAYRIKSTTTMANCEAFLKLYKSEELALVYASPGLSDSDIQVLASETRVRLHLIVNDKVTATQLAKMPKAKRVFIRDNFNKLARNADYGAPELFSDKHKTYSSAGLGFGDFTMLGNVFQDSGSTPAAVAAHAAYKHPTTGDVWLQHFVSDDTERDVGDVASKFLQSSRKLVSAARRRPAEFGWNPGLEAFANHVKSSTYPGLGKNKEYQILHHVWTHIDLITGAL